MTEATHKGRRMLVLLAVVFLGPMAVAMALYFTGFQLRPGATTQHGELYQPARPLNTMTLFDFKTLDENLGENPIGTSLDRIDPLVGFYNAALSRLGEQEFFRKTVEELLAEHPFDESRPPFTLGQPVPKGSHQ